jgi:hypothetical protein
MCMLQTRYNSVYTNNYFCRKAAIINAQNYVIIQTKYQQFLIPQKKNKRNQMCQLEKPFLEPTIEICNSQITVHTRTNLL